MEGGERGVLRSVSPSEAAEEKPSCMVCYNDFHSKSRVPKILPCGHSLCQDCITTLLSNDGFMIRRLACPTCRQTHSCSFGNSNTFPTNFSLRDMLEKQEASDKLEKGNEYSCRHCKKEFHEKNLRKCDTCCPRIQPEESLDFMGRSKLFLFCSDCITNHHVGHDFDSDATVSARWENRILFDKFLKAANAENIRVTRFVHTMTTSIQTAQNFKNNLLETVAQIQQNADHIDITSILQNFLDALPNSSKFIDMSTECVNRFTHPTAPQNNLLGKALFRLNNEDQKEYQLPEYGQLLSKLFNDADTTGSTARTRIWVRPTATRRPNTQLNAGNQNPNILNVAPAFPPNPNLNQHNGANVANFFQRFVQQIPEMNQQMQQILQEMQRPMQLQPLPPDLQLPFLHVNFLPLNLQQQAQNINQRIPNLNNLPGLQPVLPAQQQQAPVQQQRAPAQQQQAPAQQQQVLVQQQQVQIDLQRNPAQHLVVAEEQEMNFQNQDPAPQQQEAIMRPEDANRIQNSFHLPFRVFNPGYVGLYQETLGDLIRRFVNNVPGNAGWQEVNDYFFNEPYENRILTPRARFQAKIVLRNVLDILPPAHRIHATFTQLLDALREEEPDIIWLDDDDEDDEIEELDRLENGMENNLEFPNDQHIVNDGGIPNIFGGLEEIEFLLDNNAEFGLNAGPPSPIAGLVDAAEFLERDAERVVQVQPIVENENEPEADAEEFDQNEREAEVGLQQLQSQARNNLIFQDHRIGPPASGTRGAKRRAEEIASADQEGPSCSRTLSPASTSHEKLKRK